jgi:hypothetical protein
MFTPETAGNNGPGYMWQVARLHATQIGEQSKAPSSLPNLSGNAAGIAR